MTARRPAIRMDESTRQTRGVGKDPVGSPNRIHGPGHARMAMRLNLDKDVILEGPERECPSGIGAPGQSPSPGRFPYDG